MLTRENEGSKKSVRKVVQDFVHQEQYVLTLPPITCVGTSNPSNSPHESSQQTNQCHMNTSGPQSTTLGFKRPQIQVSAIYRA